ncbi:MAG: protein-tyrosine phosphatase family protein [Acidimicrobiales bacterium]
MRGKWAAGIKPRFFTWVIKDKLAICERPGGYARNHRPVRRHEEILWIKCQGFTRVVSLLVSPHNLHAYDEENLTWSHLPFGPTDNAAALVPELYEKLADWLRSGERVVVHGEQVDDRLMGVVAGYLCWSGLIPEGAQTIAIVERLFGRQMGTEGREIVAAVLEFAPPVRRALESVPSVAGG